VVMDNDPSAIADPTLEDVIEGDAPATVNDHHAGDPASNVTPPISTEGGGILAAYRHQPL
jgi:hypothetical protein